MTLYKLTEWEHNGYDDSDWYAVVYDDEKDELDRVLTGTTRFADALHCGPKMFSPTPEIMEKARAANIKMMLPTLIQREHNRVMEPYNDLVPGAIVKMTAGSKVMEKQINPCQKCNGSGKWINPKNENDKRECFGCHGHGILEGDKIKDASGKQKYIHILEGMVGEVVDSKVWGTFYKNGYNRPNRENTRVLVKFVHGTFWVAAKNLRLDQECKSPDILVEEYKNIGGDSDFYSMFRTSKTSML